MRLFVAIVPPRETREEALREAKSLPWEGKVRWLPPENVHLTLMFLGETPDSKLPELDTAIAAVCNGHREFELSLNAAGAFPSTARARVLWVGVGEGSERLESLAGDLEEVLEGLGFSREGRPFHPHATVGRARGGEARLDDPEAGNTVGPLAFRAGSVELVRSQISQEGAAYSTLASYPLVSGYPDAI